MIRYILTKIFNKYKLYLCLMIGNISIIMVFAMIMMFRTGSHAKLIQKGFTHQQELTGVFPAVLKREGDVKALDMTKLSEEESYVEFIEKDMNAHTDKWNNSLQIPVIATEKVVMMRNVEAGFSYRGFGHMNIGYMDDMTGHYNIVSGADLYQDISEYTEDGVEIPENAIPCLVSKYTADSLDLIPGELILFDKLVYGQEETGEPVLVLYVNGIISETEGDYYWQKSLEECGFTAFLDKKDIEVMLKEYPKDVHYEINESFDYRYVSTENIYDIEKAIGKISKEDATLIENITTVVTEYRESSKSVEQMLYVIVLPLIVLVLIFIGMIAFRIIDSESGELSTLRNRGLSKIRLIGMYVIQSFILAGVSIPIGVGLAYVSGKMVAGVTDFMGFSFGDSAISVKDYRFTSTMIVGAVVAAFIAVIVMIIPVILYFLKKNTRRKTASIPAWEKYFIDVALMVVSIYLLFNYNKQISTLSMSVMNGEGIDPIIFINSTLFLFASGMIMLRIIFYIVRLIFKIGEKRFKPVIYAGMLQILRTRKASGIISIFLVMTVAMSLFNANMARTINSNKQARLQYSCGADIRIQENWKPVIVGPPGNKKWKYNEPTYGPYEKMVDDGSFSSMTKVLISDRATFKVSGKETPDVTLMGIHTKEFGETATLRDGITKEHWYNYLNALAEETEGVIISQNLAKLFNLNVGDSITCDMYPPRVTGLTGSYANASFKVVAIVDAWPGYNKYKYEVDETSDNGDLQEKENYLAVINYGNATSHFGILPYEIWAKSGNLTGEDEIQSRITEYLENDSRRLDFVTTWRDELKEEKSTAIMQITNGLFTADFLIAIVLCIIGYMIYWITSIRDRELLFGIYRAMGISRKEINIMLGIEQLFLSLMSILAGVIAGLLASRFFAGVFAAVYLPQKHSIPVFSSFYGGDLFRLGAVLIVVVVICIVWIRRIVKGLNITEALKLGDD